MSKEVKYRSKYTEEPRDSPELEFASFEQLQGPYFRLPSVQVNLEEHFKSPDLKQKLFH